MFNKSDAEHYFLTEKKESRVFFYIGIVAIVLSLVFYFYYKTPYHRGAAIPFFVLGILECVFGYNVFHRSDRLRSNTVYQMDMNPSAIAKTELPRMDELKNRFISYRLAELILLITGCALVYFYKSHIMFWRGLGIGLIIQSAIMITADIFAQIRGNTYRNGLREFVKK